MNGVVTYKETQHTAPVKVHEEAWLSAVSHGPRLYVKASLFLEEDDELYEPVVSWRDQHQARVVQRYEEPDEYMMMGVAIITVYESRLEYERSA